MNTQSKPSQNERLRRALSGLIAAAGQYNQSSDLLPLWLCDYIITARVPRRYEVLRARLCELEGRDGREILDGEW